MLQHSNAIHPLGRDDRHRHFGPLLEFSPDAIVIVDAEGLVREFNPAAERMLETTVTAGAQLSLSELLCTAHREVFDRAWQQLLDGNPAPHVKATSDTFNGTVPPLDVTVAPLHLGEELAGAVVILRDAPATHMASQADNVMAGMPPVAAPRVTTTWPELDGPAGLPGRRWLHRHLSVPEAEGLERGVAVFNIDAFALLISTYGPDAADAVQARLGELLKSLDTPGTFGHWRAETFVWFVDTADPVAALDQCVASLAEALTEPIAIGDDRGWLTLSFGLATTAAVTDGDLLAAARDALQVAKLAGGSAAVYFDASMATSAASSFKLASELHYAIDHDELRLHYQPIMDFATNEITGVEALVRWERPGVGLLAPARFLDVAERTGQMVSLGDWVIRTACHNALRLGNHTGGPRTMSVNVSASQLQDPSLIVTLIEAMAEGKCAPSTIVIEVTESVLLHDLQAVAVSLEAIKALNIGLDLDDFGTGYSSLQYLRNLPIDRLKVDQGFVAGLGVSGADTAIVASTIALAHALGLRSIAEGVETIQQLTLLRELGCDFAQGYLISRPTDMEAFSAWLDAYIPEEVFPQTHPTDGRRATTREEAAERRDKRADRRDEKADRRDLKSSTRETKANARDTTATTRDSEANDRDTEANTRDLTANTRDTEANSRDNTADGREAIANARDRVADLRDAAASQREHAEDDRESSSDASRAKRSDDSAAEARLAESGERHRAAAVRKVEATDRADAGRGRDDASLARNSGASDPTPKRANGTSEDGRE